MPNISVALPSDRLLKLQEIAARLGVTPEDLVRASIEEMLARPDDTFQQVVDHVLNKNAELYQRLA